MNAPRNVDAQGRPLGRYFDTLPASPKNEPAGFNPQTASRMQPDRASDPGTNHIKTEAVAILKR